MIDSPGGRNDLSDLSSDACTFQQPGSLMIVVDLPFAVGPHSKQMPLEVGRLLFLHSVENIGAASTSMSVGSSETETETQTAQKQCLGVSESEKQ